MTFAPLPEHAVEAMCDLETLGTQARSVILTIGCVRFEMYGQVGTYEPFYQAIKLESCLDRGLRIQSDTLRWWMKQSPAAQAAAFEDPNAVELPAALDAFTEWWGSRPDHLWGNSAKFDLGILEDAYRACGMDIPWNGFKERCYRTLKTLPGMTDIKLKRIGTHHNALDDAISQAVHCRELLRKLAPATGPFST